MRRVTSEQSDLTYVSQQASHLPGYVAGAAITAAFALWLREGRTSIMLPVLMVMLPLSYRFPNRIRRPIFRAIFRVALYAATAVLYKLHPPQNQNVFIDSFVLDQIGELCLAEIVIRAWSKYPGVSSNRAVAVLLTGVVYVMATNTYDETIGRYFTPPFMILLIMGIQSVRAEAMPEARKRARFGVATAAVGAFALGSLLFVVLTINRDALMEWANRMLTETNMTFSSSGLSEESHLSSSFGRAASYDRVLRVRTTADVSYMRAYPMYTYQRGFWTPSPRKQDRHYTDVKDSDLETGAIGTPAEVTSFSNMRGMLLFPLNTISLQADGGGRAVWAREEGGPLRFDGSVPDAYSLQIGGSDAQGLLCARPDAAYRKQLLQLSDGMDHRIRGLAKQITAGLSDPLKKALAIAAYLPAHHEYSLHIEVNEKDPIGDFLFSNKAAHCEFFATAAVILMRYAGLPARYVIGYYAHERADDGSTIVRQRDAHAWAECWIEGRGWITIDATPGSGRPDGDDASVPAWKRAIERMQDGFANFRQNLTLENTLRVAGLFVCVVLIVFLVQNRYHFKWSGKRKGVVQDYTVAPIELQKLHARFEIACRKQGLTCPPAVPWQVYLSSAPVSTQDVSQVPAAVRSAALRFVAAYNLARFGGRFNAEDNSGLGDLVMALEREANRAKSQGGAL